MARALYELAEQNCVGERLTYHTGFLCIDKENNPPLEKISGTALKLAEAGKILLFQKRLDKNRFEYIAVKPPKIENK